MIPMLAGDDDFYVSWDWESWEEPEFTGYCDLDCTYCYPFD